ncbi:MAG: right-handed parallel beta-helix repeat-containing protein [Parasporobacterium sp.]|nr:right-handed parallel beta-helix repeat-containing protein [Parasporobacterium sp.]
MKKKLATKLFGLLCALCMTAGVFGSINYVTLAADSTKTDYLKTIDVTAAPYNANGKDKISDNGICKAIQDAASLSNPKKKPILIKIPAGTYYIDYSILISSNIHLKLDKKATIVRRMIEGEMLRSYGSAGGYGQVRNVVIDGGTWDGNVHENSNKDYYSLFKFAHGSDITIRNTTLKNSHGQHMIILDGMKNVTIEKVNFSNQYFYTGSDSSYYFSDLPKSFSSYTAKDWSRLAEGKEAVHLDYTNSTGADSSYPMDNTVCSKITVKNCTFNNILSGIGSHHTIKGLSMPTIEMTGNTFKNVKGYAISGYQMKGLTVKNNTVSSAGEFAIIKDSTATLSGNTVSNVSYAIHGENSTITVRADSYSANDTLGIGNPVVRVMKADPYSAQSMNNASASLTMKNSTVDGAFNGGVWAREITCNLDNVTVRNGGSYGAVYFYNNSNGSVNNCTISSTQSGFHAYDCKSSKGIVISGNTISNCGKMGIELWDTSYITMTNNKVTGSKDNGIDIYIGSTSNSICTGNGVTSNVDANISQYLGSNNTIRDNYVIGIQNGWLKVGNLWYYLKGGFAQTGWQKISNVWYFFDSSGAMATGWRNISNTWYFFDSSGAMATGWRNISNTWYFFKSDGSMAASEWFGGYWFGSSGAWTYKAIGSWKQNQTGWWFGDTSGWYAKNETIKIDGKYYTFKANGYWIQSKQANPMKVKKTTYTFKYSDLKKAKSFNIDVTNAQGKVTFTLNTAAKKAGIKVTSKGKVTIPKNCKKGTYKITVKAAGNNKYKEASKTVSITVK